VVGGQRLQAILDRLNCFQDQIAQPGFAGRDEISGREIRIICGLGGEVVRATLVTVGPCAAKLFM
jgi:hypothetical protein